MDLNSPMYDNIKIEADSDCAFFGLAAISDGCSNTTNLLEDFSNLTNSKLNTLLSSVSPYTISSPNRVNTSKSVSSKVLAEVESSPSHIPASSVENVFGEVLFPADFTEQLELDLPEFTCDFDMLDNDAISNAFLRDDSDSKDSETSSTPDVYLGSPSAMDSPPLTPPSPMIKLETETRPQTGFGPFPTGALPMLKNFPNGTNLTKILPSLKSSRGRSASHDSPDIQALKRHIRMIRNRESASLSRKKKKEYVTTLEQRLQEIEIENAQLKQENQLLRTRLLMQQQHNNSGHNNQHTTKINGASLPNNAGRIGSNTNKTKLIAKVALLGVCCFMILSAHAPINQNPHARHEVISNSSRNSKVLQNFGGQSDFPHHLTEFPTNHLRISRSLGWRDDFKEGSDRLDMPEKKIRKVNNVTLEKHVESRNVTRSTPLASSTIRYNAQHRRPSVQHSFNNVSLPIRNMADITEVAKNNCKALFNKTESLRVQNDLKGLFNRDKPKKKAPTRPFFYSLMDLSNVDNSDKGLTVYDQRMQRYTNFLEKLQLREDTFYVVSLAMDDQLLLSAKSSNASSRPKMSFLMPWRNDSRGGKEEVMQIDCEVTKVLNIKNLRRNSKP